MLLKKDSLAIKVREQNHLTKYSAPCLRTTCTKCQIISPKGPFSPTTKNRYDCGASSGPLFLHLSLFCSLGTNSSTGGRKSISLQHLKRRDSSHVGTKHLLGIQQTEMEFQLSKLTFFLPSSQQAWFLKYS